MLQNRAPKTRTSFEFEHITCREPNNSVNFVCMAIDWMACTLEYNFFLSQYKQNQINHAISSQVENKIIRSIHNFPEVRRYFLQYWMFVCLGRNSNPAMAMVFIKEWKLNSIGWFPEQLLTPFPILWRPLHIYHLKLVFVCQSKQSRQYSSYFSTGF